MVHCTVLILIFVWGAYLISDVQSMHCLPNGTLRRVGRLFRKEKSLEHSQYVPVMSQISMAEELKRLKDECQRLKVAENPPPEGFNIDQPANQDTPRGNTSEVVRVEFGEQHNKKPYAVKRISMPWIADPSRSAYAYRDTCTEMKILQDVEHPFIIKLLWSLYNEKYAVLIFNYYEMGDFVNLTRSTGPLSEEKAKFYAAQLVLVVEYLHEKNIVHRDIKADNIMVDNEGYLKVTDFGASVVDDGKLVNDVAGTPRYVAPEVLRASRFNFRQYSRKPTDVWSLGIVIYTMLFGTFPDDSDDIDSMMNLMRRVRLPEHVYKKVGKNIVGMKKLKFHKSTEKLAIGEMLLGMLNKNPKGRLTIKKVKEHESWNTPSDWIKSGSNPPKFNWEALQQREFRAPIRPSKNFKNYIDTETGYKFDKVVVPQLPRSNMTE